MRPVAIAIALYIGLQGGASYAQSGVLSQGIVLTEPDGLELGVYGGAFLPNDDHEFYDFRKTSHVPLDPIGPELGIRVGYFPVPFAGFEVEGDLMPFGTEGASGVLLFGMRGQLAVRPVAGRVRPLAVLGLGVMGVRSGELGLANDTDAVGHAGLGLEASLGRMVSVRLDGRYLRAPAANSDAGTNHFAALLGVTLNLGSLGQRSAPPTAETTEVVTTTGRDSDGDGVPDARDRCPDRPVRSATGCPAPDSDDDGDGFAFAVDACPDAAEDVNGVADNDGCPEAAPVPMANGDGDGDGLGDGVDGCPNEAGPAENGGCPDSDADRDSVVDRLDNCPEMAGTVAFHGCTRAQSVVIGPSEIELTRPVPFRGTNVDPDARQVLANLAEVLIAHPELRVVRIVVRADNQSVADKRAKALQGHLVSRGVRPDQIETLGEAEDSGDKDVQILIIEGLLRGDSVQ